jgi:hypothetical protein
MLDKEKLFKLLREVLAKDEHETQRT